MYSIYKLTSPSGKCYIGQTKNDIALRVSQHDNSYQVWLAKDKPHKTGYQPKLLYAFDKYGINAFKKEIIDSCETYTEANILEEKYIQQYNSIENGYNTQKGGGGWNKLHLEESHKTRIGNKKKNWWDSEKGQKKKLEFSERNKKYNPGAEAKRGKPSWNSGKKCPEHSLKLKKYYETHNGSNLGRIFPLEWRSKMGRKGSRTKLQLEAAKKNGIKRRGIPSHPNQKEGARKALQKEWLITDPQGNQFRIINLNQFCKEKNLESTNIKTKSGSKKWKATKIDSLHSSS